MPRPDTIVFFQGFGGDVESNVSVESSFPAYFLYMAFCYCLPFFVGLHFTYPDFSPWFQQIELNNHGLKRLTASHWIFLVVVVVLGGCFAAYQTYLFYLEDMLWWYLLGIGVFMLGLVAVVVLMTQRYDHYLHIHHYQLFGGLMILTRFQNSLSAVMQGLLAGAYVEGVARWGMDALLIPNRH